MDPGAQTDCRQLSGQAKQPSTPNGPTLPPPSRPRARRTRRPRAHSTTVAADAYPDPPKSWRLSRLHAIRAGGGGLAQCLDTSITVTDDIFWAILVRPAGRWRATPTYCSEPLAPNAEWTSDTQGLFYHARDI